MVNREGPGDEGMLGPMAECRRAPIKPPRSSTGQIRGDLNPRGRTHRGGRHESQLECPDGVITSQVIRLPCHGD